LLCIRTNITLKLDSGLLRKAEILAAKEALERIKAHSEKAEGGIS
jgi:hypothetical protein